MSIAEVDEANRTAEVTCLKRYFETFTRVKGLKISTVNSRVLLEESLRYSAGLLISLIKMRLFDSLLLLLLPLLPVVVG